MLSNNTRPMAEIKAFYFLMNILGFTAWAGSIIASLIDIELWKAIPMSIMGAVWMYYKIQEKREDIRKKRLENDKFEKEAK